MIGALKPYPVYRDSGEEVLGGVPVDWEVRSLGQLGRFSKGLGGTKDDEVDSGVPCVRYGDLYTRHEFFITATRSFLDPQRAQSYTPTRSGDVLFAASGETIAEIGKSAVNLLPGEVRVGGDVILFRPRDVINERFLGYACDAEPSVLQKARMGRGVTVMHINTHRLRRLQIVVPPLEEQTAIVRCLDRVCSRIQRLIAAKERLIELLEEEKQAIIQRAVTRGLDSSVRLKPSGVDWLGEVPEHWEVRRMKSLSLIRRGASPRPIDDPRFFAVDGEYSWVRISDVTASGGELTETSQRMSEDGHARSVRLEPGSLFLSIAGSVGKPVITRIKCCVHDGFVYFPTLSADVDFLYYALGMPAVYDGLGKFGTQLNLNTETVGQIRIGIPPRIEQRSIASYIRASCNSKATVIKRLSRQIGLAEELRTRLIADVVTGKLDVREAAANLPDDPGTDAPVLDDAIEEAVA